MESLFTQKLPESQSINEEYCKQKQEFFENYGFKKNTTEDMEKNRYVKATSLSERSVNRIEDPDILTSPEKLQMYFERNGFRNLEPLSVVKKEGTTLYVSSGVQVLDPVIHAETEIPKDKMFIAQPVIRTQFIDSVKDYTSTSFINLSTLSVNKGIADHFEDIKKWFIFLESIGLSKDDLVILEKESTPKWGERKFNNYVLKFLYKDLEIGDAVYIPTMPQDSRPAVSISDIGFGFERLNSLSKDSKYFNEIIKSNSEFIDLDIKVLDYIRTLTLIASSGVTPSNTEHGYRFRLFSKKLIKDGLYVYSKMEGLINLFYDEWAQYTSLPETKEKSFQIIKKENERNLNRVILDEVNKKYKLVGLDINRTVGDFLAALKNSGVKDEDIKELIIKHKIYD